MESRKGGGCDGKGKGERAAKWSFLHGSLLLLKTHGYQSPSGVSKCFPCSLTKVSGREVHIWWNTLVHGSSEDNGEAARKPMSWSHLCHRIASPSPRHKLSLCTVLFCSPSLYSCLCVCILIGRYLKSAPTVPGAFSHSTMQTMKTDSKELSLKKKNNLQTWAKIKPMAKPWPHWKWYKHSDKKLMRILPNDRLFQARPSTEERTLLLGLARVQTGTRARDNRTTKDEGGDEKQEELHLFDMRTRCEGQWVQSSEEEELSAVVAQGQKGMRVGLNKVWLITGEGLPNIAKDWVNGEKRWCLLSSSRGCHDVTVTTGSWTSFSNEDLLKN